MTRRQEILEDDVFIVGGSVEHTLPAPNGLPDLKAIQALQKEFFNFSIEHLVDEITTVKKNYPEKDTMAISVTADFVVMKREDFAELMNLENE